jgi:hypothetical protein
MTHTSAVENMMVERYLLGELTGETRDQFEEHLFDCAECAADLKQGVLFLDAARQELKSSQKTPEPIVLKPVQRSRPALGWLLQPWALGPALAACLAVIVYQSAVLIPHLKADAGIQVAQAQAPSVLEPLMLANAGARGDSTAEITALRQGVYLLSVDIPPAPGALRYRCSLVSASGVQQWHVDVSAQQAKDAVVIQVPVAAAGEGLNELHVQSVSPSATGGDTLVDLATYRYRLKFAQ